MCHCFSDVIPDCSAADASTLPMRKARYLDLSRGITVHHCRSILHHSAGAYIPQDGRPCQRAPVRGPPHHERGHHAPAQHHIHRPGHLPPLQWPFPAVSLGPRRNAAEMETRRRRHITPPRAGKQMVRRARPPHPSQWTIGPPSPRQYRRRTARCSR